MARACLFSFVQDCSKAANVLVDPVYVYALPMSGFMTYILVWVDEVRMLDIFVNL